MDTHRWVAHVERNEGLSFYRHRLLNLGMPLLLSAIVVMIRHMLKCIHFFQREVEGLSWKLIIRIVAQS